jgi:TRAP-type C4-dicarboxylate transport system substrate-binding protein
MRKAVLSILVLAMALALPGSARTAEAKTKNMIRIATLAPRDTELTRGFARIDRALRQATGDGWGIQLYPSGIAGDEKDVIRKMRIGQMDGSVVTTTGLSQIVREVSVLNAPGVINDYPQLERVQAAMKKEWADAFEKNGFKLVAWGEVGQYRYFSKTPLRRPSDLKTMRPWMWPESHTMKELYKAVGATGVPLQVPEVYGALQTNMVDAVISTALATVALQWHTKLNHVTRSTHGVLTGAMVLDKRKWDSIPADVKAALEEQIRKNTEGDAENVRKNDQKAFEKLLARGYVATDYSAQGAKEYEAIAKTVRERMAGRVYSRELLERVMRIAQGG